MPRCRRSCPSSSTRRGLDEPDLPRSFGGVDAKVNAIEASAHRDVTTICEPSPCSIMCGKPNRDTVFCGRCVIVTAILTRVFVPSPSLVALLTFARTCFRRIDHEVQPAVLPRLICSSSPSPTHPRSVTAGLIGKTPACWPTTFARGAGGQGERPRSLRSSFDIATLRRYHPSYRRGGGALRSRGAEPSYEAVT